MQYLAERIGLDPLKADAEGVTAWDEAHSLGKQEVLDYFQERYGYSWEETYHNPIRRGFFSDPSIVREGQDYYMVNSSFVFFPLYSDFTFKESDTLEYYRLRDHRSGVCTSGAYEWRNGILGSRHFLV